jgi:hypothetical protein
MNKCSALINGRCRNGFFTTPACNPVSASTTPPMCMNEDWCARIYHKTDGLPPVLFKQLQENQR